MEKRKVLFLGGGFANVFGARALHKKAGDRFGIELVNQTNYFVFQPLLPEVAAGGVTSSDAVAPLRLLLEGCQVRQGSVIGIDLDAHKVTVVQGTRRLPVTLDYDHLVLGLGQIVDLSKFPGLEEHGLTVKNLADAHRLRNQIIGCLEAADVTRRDYVRREMLTFVVVGAGFSGVETVGEIKELIDRSLKFYPNLNAADVRVCLVEYAGRILLELDEDLATYARKRLEERGVEVITGVGTRSATAAAVELTDGRIIETRTVVATIGNAPNPLMTGLGLPMEWGRVCVERTMRVPGRDDVWCVGDAAKIPMKDDPGEDRADYAPPTAQFAVREGEQLAANLIAVEEGRALKNFAYASKGSLASLGTSKAVAQVYGIKLTGVLAWLLWRGFYLSFLPGWATRIRVGVNWLLNAIVPRNIVQVQDIGNISTRYLYYRKGDKVFEPGMLADGFYTVMEGAFRLEVEDPETGETITREFGPGDHFGERVILGTGVHTGLVTALENSRCFWVRREDFHRFAKAFPVLDNYFQDYIERNFGPSGVRLPQEEAPTVPTPASGSPELQTVRADAGAPPENNG